MHPDQPKNNRSLNLGSLEFPGKSNKNVVSEMYFPLLYFLKQQPASVPSRGASLNTFYSQPLEGWGLAFLLQDLAFLLQLQFPAADPAFLLKLSWSSIMSPGRRNRFGKTAQVWTGAIKMLLHLQDEVCIRPCHMLNQTWRGNELQLKV